MFEGYLYFLYLHVATVIIKNMVWKERVQTLCAYMELYHVIVFFDVGIIILY